MNTLFDKIWDAHTVKVLDGGSCVLYIDRQYIHEVTSPQAFAGLRERGIGVFRPSQVTASPDHNIPTVDQHLPIAEPQSAAQVAALCRNCDENGITIFPIGSQRNGIIHVMGPETGLTRPGMTIVCGDSHTSTHGALGCVAFGIGTSEVEMALASQCILQSKPTSMRINVEGELRRGVCSKDILLYIISKLGTGGGTGHFVEFAGSAIRSLSMEARMTICNMSIEMGARGGMIAPDETTFEYLRGREFAPQGAEWNAAVERWSALKSEPDAVFDKEVTFNAADIEPMITYGTNPGMGVAVNGAIPASDGVSFDKALDYMGFREGEKMAGKRVDYVFVGSCTNGRIEDLRAFATLVEGRRKAPNVTAWIVPGSKQVERQAIEEGLRDKLEAAGFTLRQPGCSACLAMNEDKIPAGKYCVATSNRNFEGRQGPEARTMLAGPLVAAAAAVTGVVTDPMKPDRNEKQIHHSRLDGGAPAHREHRHRPDHSRPFPQGDHARGIRRKPLSRLALRRRGEPQARLRDELAPLQGRNSRRGQELRLRIEPRARRVGHSGSGIPRGGVEFLRRHIPQQRPQQRTSARDGERSDGGRDIPRDRGGSRDGA